VVKILLYENQMSRNGTARLLGTSFRQYVLGTKELFDVCWPKHSGHASRPSDQSETISGIFKGSTTAGRTLLENLLDNSKMGKD